MYNGLELRNVVSGCRIDDAEHPSDIPGRGWFAVLQRIAQSLYRDDVWLRSAAVAFSALFAAIPVAAVVVSVVGLLADPGRSMTLSICWEDFYPRTSAFSGRADGRDCPYIPRIHLGAGAWRRGFCGALGRLVWCLGIDRRAQPCIPRGRDPQFLAAILPSLAGGDWCGRIHTFGVCPRRPASTHLGPVVGRSRIRVHRLGSPVACVGAGMRALPSSALQIRAEPPCREVALGKSRGRSGGGAVARWLGNLLARCLEHAGVQPCARCSRDADASPVVVLPHVLRRAVGGRTKRRA